MTLVLFRFIHGHVCKYTIANAFDNGSSGSGSFLSPMLIAAIIIGLRVLSRLLMFGKLKEEVFIDTFVSGGIEILNSIPDSS